MVRQLYCKNIECRYNQNEERCGAIARIGMDGKCDSFEKNILYYIHLVRDTLNHRNFIDFVDIDLQPDLRLGIFYICKIYHISFSICDWGTCRLFQFKKNENEDGLTYDQITSMKIDIHEYRILELELLEGKMPQITKAPALKDFQPFGWLSPRGEFIEANIGDHEKEAGQIIKNENFDEEFEEWEREKRGRSNRDFLIDVKGYCLIHNPFGTGGYLVSYNKILSKKQREFLYQYFKEIGDQFKAEEFLKTEC